MRGKNLIQLIKALSLLSRPQGCTKKDLAESLGIGDRSVSSYIQKNHRLKFISPKTIISAYTRWP